MVYNPDCKWQAEVDQQQRNIKYIIIYANNVPCAMNHNKTGQADTRFLRSTARVRALFITDGAGVPRFSHLSTYRLPSGAT